MKVDLKYYKGFALTKGESSIEATQLNMLSITKDIPLITVPKKTPCPAEYVPCGSVEWCEQTLGYHVKPDYYPEWLNQYLYRNVWKADKWPLGEKVFIKPADRYKRFTGFCTIGTYKRKKKPPYWCSEIIKFTNEWRYYVSNGKVLCGEWYWGDEVNTPLAPELNIVIPSEYCGALDFGISDGVLTLVEAQHPFACGWYGKDTSLYAQWLVDGWEHVNRR